MAAVSDPPPPRGYVPLALGFRPFYLLAAGWAVASVPLWAAQFAGLLPGANQAWHAHEMVFGFAFAVIAGFLLTAVRAWTGRATPTGAPLAVLASVWVAARVAGLASLHAAAGLDAAFATMLAWSIGRPLVASGNRRNWFFVALVLALGGASIASLQHPAGLAIGLDVVLFALAVVGGRVIPLFTGNALPGVGSRRHPWLDRAALISVLLLLPFAGRPADAAWVALPAAALHAARLVLWRGWRTARHPILWILHLSYAWIPVHLLLRGLAGLGWLAPMPATHALTVGAIGGMTLGMMTRTARGHTARPLVAGRLEVASYLLVQLAALVRVSGPLAMPAHYVAAVVASAGLWSGAFALYLVGFVPVLVRPRLDGRPG